VGVGDHPKGARVEGHTHKLVRYIYSKRWEYLEGNFQMDSNLAD